jgi:hypothetical protein
LQFLWSTQELFTKGKKMRSAVYFLKASVFLTIIIGITMSGCSKRTLPSTNVAPTRENKKIVAFLEQYKNALEKRSVEAILELVAKDFSDNMGSEDPKLQLDYLGLKERLETALPRIQDLRIGMFVQHIEKVEKDKYYVVFYFNKHVLMDVPSGEKWTAIREVSRMTIRRRHEKNSPYEFEILQGI